MRLYELNCSCKARYDFYDSFIIAANSIREARKFAAKASADEGEEVWATASYSVIGIAARSVKPGIVLGSFNAA